MVTTVSTQHSTWALQWQTTLKTTLRTLFQCDVFSCYCMCDTMPGNDWMLGCSNGTALQRENRPRKSHRIFQTIWLDVYLVCLQTCLEPETHHCDMTEKLNYFIAGCWNTGIRCAKKHGLDKWTALLVLSCLYSLYEVYRSHCLMRASMV